MISAVVHTYNEEKNIERCLLSLSFVDEIVVIDMGSIDNTCSIAKKYKSKVYSHPFTGFVEPARNFGISKASGDWIIIVDADEEVPKSLADYLVTAGEGESFDFYRIARKNIIFGRWVKHAGWWPDYQIRFFRKGNVTWTEKIHGVPITYGTGIDLEAVEKLSIIHHNYQNFEQFIGRLNRYSSISSKELFLANKHFSIGQLFEMPAKEFINRYFIWHGYKDGIHGLALSLLQSFSELVTYLKLWELEDFREEKVNLKDMKKLFNREYQMKNYWFFSKMLEESNNLFESLVLRIKRKLGLYV